MDEEALMAEPTALIAFQMFQEGQQYKGSVDEVLKYRYTWNTLFRNMGYK